MQKEVFLPGILVDCLVGFKEYRDTSVTGYVCAVNV